MAKPNLRTWLWLGTAALIYGAGPSVASAQVIIGGGDADVEWGTPQAQQPQQLQFEIFDGVKPLMPLENKAGMQHLILQPPKGVKTGNSTQGTLVPIGSSSTDGFKLVMPEDQRVVLTPPPGVKVYLTPPPQRKISTTHKPKVVAKAPVVESASSAAPKAIVKQDKPETAVAVAPPTAMPQPQQPAVTEPTPAPAPAQPDSTVNTAKTVGNPQETKVAVAIPDTPTPPPAPPTAMPEPPKAIEPAPDLPVIAPAPPPAPAQITAVPEPEAVDVAAVTPPKTPVAPSESVNANTATIALVFDAGEAHLGDTHRVLLKGVVDELLANPDSSVQLMAFAKSDDRSKSRRLSLSRALAARSYLLQHDIRNTRIQVRAMGDQATGGKPDRVDVTVSAP